MPELNDKQRAFVAAYVRTGIGSVAFREAGYAAKSAHQASAGAARLLAYDGIRELLDSILTGNATAPPPDATVPPRHDEAHDGFNESTPPLIAEVVIRPARSVVRKTVEEIVAEMESVAFGEPDEPLTWAAKTAMLDRLAKMHRLLSDGITVNVASAGELDGIDYVNFTDEELYAFERLLAIGRGRRPPERGHAGIGPPADAAVRDDPQE